MALVECPDCGRKVSDQAEACPACAHPVKARIEAAEAKSGVGGGGVSTRGRDVRAPAATARLVVLETPTAPASSSAPAERRPSVQTFRAVCHRCGDEEVFLYPPPRTDRHVCGSCEEKELLSGVHRSRLLHWWPFALLVVMFLGGVIYFVLSAPQ